MTNLESSRVLARKTNEVCSHTLGQLIVRYSSMKKMSKSLHCALFAPRRNSERQSSLDTNVTRLTQTSKMGNNFFDRYDYIGGGRQANGVAFSDLLDTVQWLKVGL